MFVVLISGIACVLTAMLLRRAVARAREAGETIGRGRMVAAALPVVLQAALAVYAALGLVQNDIISAVLANLALAAVAHVAFNRAQVRAKIDERLAGHARLNHPLLITIVFLLLAGAFATLALEIPSNHNLLWMYPGCLALEFFLVTALLVALFCFGQRRTMAPGILAFGFWVLGVAEYFVVLFKSMPISPGDLSALSTAAAVAGNGYRFELSAFCLYGMVFLCLAIVCLQLASAYAPKKEERTKKQFWATLMVGVLCFGGVAAHVTLLDYYNTLGIQVYTWRPLESYYRQGFLPAFISGAQTIKPPVPRDYAQGEAKDLMGDYAKKYDKGAGATPERAAAQAQFAQEKPAVVTIMNETFSDLSIYQNLHAGYEGPRAYKELADCLQRGTLYVSAYGGGTCNTEFEYLTGNSMAYLGSGVYPYTIYDLTRTESLPAKFRKMGYKTTAMHPNHGTNWNRDNAYAQLGFDNFLTIQDFPDAERLRDMVSDRATYDKILEMLKSDEAPQFIFDVTMQNHSGYDTGLLPADKVKQYYVDGVNDPEVDEYLALIDESDRALKEFLQKLRRLDRPVIVVFFGDHQPFFPDRYNEAWFQNEDPAVHAERQWQTDYIVWANYDVAGRDQSSRRVDLSTNFLGASMLDLVGAPMTKWDKAHESLRATMPAINATGFFDAAGVPHLSSAARDGSAAEVDGAAKKAVSAREDLAQMQFYEMFRDGKHPYTKNAQIAANETNPNLAPGTTKIK
ncbi:MAG: LTA synthase family protein [Coriobacteriaceae bacterium]|nr:LTA synthase family protein [Coriobacteriaceae bacterium]